MQSTQKITLTGKGYVKTPFGLIRLLLIVLYSFYLYTNLNFTKISSIIKKALKYKH